MDFDDSAHLDPQSEAEWAELTRVGQRAFGELASHLQTVRERDVWHEPSDAMRAFFDQPLPEQPSSLDR